MIYLSISSVSAYDFEVEGLYYDIESVSDRTCALTSGDNIYTGVVNIPDSVLVNGRYLKVIAIKAGAFLNSKELSELTIPSNVKNIDGRVFAYGSTTIGKLIFLHSPIPLTVGSYSVYPSIYSSFYNCNPTEVYIDREISSGFSSHASIEKLTIGNHIENFDTRLFNECSNLKNLRIEDSDNPIILDNKSWWAFESCPLSDVYIWRNFQFYHYGDGSSPFEGKSIERLILGSKVTILEEGAFSQCSKLNLIEFPNIEEIGSEAFSGCKQLHISEFPSSIKNIGNRSFYSCDNIKEVVLKGNVENIGIQAFDDCIGLERVLLAGDVKTIKSRAFQGCENLRYVDLGNSVEYIGFRAFGDTAIEKIVLPNSLKTVDEEAFYNCIKLKELEIGNGIRQIGDGAFNSGYLGTIELDSIIIRAITPPTITENTFSSKSYLNCKVVVPSESLDIYKSSTGWSNFWSIEGGMMSGIHRVFAEEDKLVNIIPHGIQAQCDGLFDIYSIKGEKVRTSHLRKGDTLNLSMGLYVVKCSNRSQKIYIR